MKRYAALFLAIAMAFSVAACGGTTSSSSSAPASSSAVPSGSTADLNLDALGEVEVEKELFDVLVTLPADFVGETTQEELDASVQEMGIHSAPLNDDGSVTYVMSKSQHKQVMEDLAVSIRQSLDDMVGSENYPMITGIDVNDDFTNFTVTTTSTEITIQEGFSILGFYIYGGTYAIFNGSEVDNIHVDFVNADTGEIIDSADSSEMADS